MVYLCYAKLLKTKVMEIRPQVGDYPPYAQTYIDKVPPGNLLDQLTRNTNEMKKLLNALSADQWNHRYAPGKWSLKESLNHVVDTERIFAYRALCIARGEQTPLPGFDQDQYAENCQLSHVSGEDILDAFLSTRISTQIMLTHFDDHDWMKKGIASDHSTSVLALGCMIVGHANHHVNLFRDFYLA